MMSRISTEAMSSAPAAEEEDVLLNGHLATGLDYDRWWIVFRKIDLSRDNLVSKKEMLRATKHGLALTKAEIETIMTEADGKGSAGLSFGQFFSYMTGGKPLDGRVTPAVLSVFTRYDHDNDGLLSRKDLLKAIKHDGLKMTKKHVTALFEQFGQEGMLTLSDFISLISGASKPIPSSRLTTVQETFLRTEFAKFDDGEAGSLTHDQFSRLILSLTPYYTLEEIDDLFTEADANNRGLVSFDELLEFMIS